MLMALRILNSLLAIAFIFIPVTSSAEVGKKEFESIEKVSLYILSHYPKDEYIYVGIGRSPVPVMAYLQSEENTLIRNLPLTNFRHGTETYPPLTHMEESKLFQHFDRYLPSDSELKGRAKILAIDLAVGGASLATSQSYLDKYIKSLRSKLTSVKGIAIVLESDAKQVESMYPDLDTFPLKGGLNPERSDHFGMMMATKLYKDKAEHQAFDIKNPTNFRTRPEYQEYVTEIRDAKQKHKLGLLNDDWTTTLFDMTENPGKYSDILAILLFKNSRLSDAESTRIAKEMISKQVAQKRTELKLQYLATPSHTRAPQPKLYPSHFFGYKETSSCVERRRASSPKTPHDESIDQFILETRESL